MIRDLTPKERLIYAAKMMDVDRPPCICPGGMMNMMFEDIMKISDCFWPDVHCDAKKMSKLAVALYQNGGFENYGVPFCMTVEAESMGAIVNMGNMLCEPHVVSPILKSCDEVDNLKPIDVNSGRVKTVIDAIKLLKAQNSDVPIIGNIIGPISLGGTLLDMSTLLRDFRKKPEQVMKYLSFICENLIVFAKAQIEAGADIICISEPSGTGEILGLKLFEQYTIKCLNTILDSISTNIKIVHICGSLKSVYPVIHKIHSEVFSFDAIVPISEIKPYLPNHVLMGNINTFALGTMNSCKIKTLVEFALSKNIGIVSPACGLTTKTPLDNVQSMVSTVKNYYRD